MGSPSDHPIADQPPWRISGSCSGLALTLRWRVPLQRGRWDDPRLGRGTLKRRDPDLRDAHRMVTI
jgi:hypothetical protein